MSMPFPLCFPCIGGDSGLAEDANDNRLDCRGVCDGDWVDDTCGFCEPYSRVNYTGGSKYMDCSSTCVTPGKLSDNIDTPKTKNKINNNKNSN